MADNPYPSIVGGVTNGLDARTALNKVGADSEIGIRTVSSISVVATEIGYYKTNTVVRARDTNLYYKYNGSTWNIDTDYNTVEATLTLADNVTNNVSTSKHGFAPKAPNDATKYLDGTGAYSVPAGTVTSDATLVTTDITTNNVSTSKHGFAPKAPNDATKYLDGTGAWTVPAGGGGGVGSPALNIYLANNFV